MFFFHSLQARQHSVNSQWLQWEDSMFDPPQNRRPSTDRQKFLQGWLCLWPLSHCQIWYRSVHGRLVGKWNKTKCVRLSLLGTHQRRPYSLTDRWIFTFDGSKSQTTRTYARICIRGFVHCIPKPARPYMPRLYRPVREHKTCSLDHQKYFMIMINHNDYKLSFIKFVQWAKSSLLQ